MRKSIPHMPATNTSFFAQIKGEVIFDTTLSDGAYRFLSVVIYLSGSNDHCWYTQKQLAEKLGLEGKYVDRTIRNYQNECERKNYLLVERPGYHQANKLYPLVKVIPQDRPVIHDESPIPQDRKIETPTDRNQKPDKLHAPNNNQYKRASSPFVTREKCNINFANYLPGGKYAPLMAHSGG